MIQYNNAAYPIGDLALLKRKIQTILTKQSIGILLDSNEYKLDSYSKYQLVAGFDPIDELIILTDDPINNPFDELKSWRSDHTFSLGFFSYDLKNSLENLSSENKQLLELPLLYFFIPRHLLIVETDTLIIYSIGNPSDILNLIDKTEVEDSASPITTLPATSYPDRQEYLSVIQNIKDHILEGDVYEMNYCRFFEVPTSQIDSISLLDHMMASSRAPFASYIKYYGKEVFCSSPERFICKRSDQLISQPIKGTIKRGSSAREDEDLQRQLRESEKDQAENIMIVDLVRNDLSRSCRVGSVQVEELFGIYPFKTVTQMISTISGTLDQHCHPIDAIAKAFPMGSMTGAPKVMAMSLIEKYEAFKRGIFSGSIGYFDFEDDFDFNVVIRSVLYDADQQKTFLPVGGAIVYDSDPQSEYEESLLKAKNMLNILGVKD